MPTRTKAMISQTWSWCTDISPSSGLALILAIALIAISWYYLLIKTSKAKLPPGPRGLPVIGSLPFLKPDLHRYYAELASTYGPIMKIQFGCKLCIVITSPSVAKEVLKDHDTTFADRDTSAMLSTLSYGCVGMIWSPYNENWRMLRKVCVREILNHGRLEASYGFRRREVRDMVSQICAKSGTPINIREQIIATMLNIMTSTMWGNTLDRDEMSSITAEYKRVKQKMTGLVNEVNISDLFPALARFDIQGKERRMLKIMTWFDKIFNLIIDRRRQMEKNNGHGKSNDKENMDFVQVLLQLIDQGEQKTPFTETHIKSLFLDLTLAGTSTTTTTVEWAMAELIKHPQIIWKIREELEEVVGKTNIAEESHVPKLRYLDAVIKEVLRLHPPVPLLLPRRARESSIIGGYNVPKGAQVLVNAWAMQRDPKYWENPLQFRPERFLNSSKEWDYNGNHFHYIPFGSGRRICAGIPMVERLVPYLLASLVHSFLWELPEGTELDLSEAYHMELRKKTPIEAIPTPRLLDSKLYT